jgi:D-hydroxyproline dehydrogenase subunit gamma
MHDEIVITVNGEPMRVSARSTVAAALAGEAFPCRVSVRGERRMAVCGMGACMECRAEVDGELHVRTCELLCRPGMRVRTQ